MTDETPATQPTSITDQTKYVTNPLGHLIQLALQIESNSIEKDWATDLRRGLQAHNTRVADACNALLVAIQRVELANTEGNPILSAWLPHAKAVLARINSQR